MASDALAKPAAATEGSPELVPPFGWSTLWATRTILLVWLPIVAISAAHYATGPELLWVHNVLRRLYYLPIIVAAFLGGLRGGIAAAAVASASYLPHAFLHLEHLAHSDPGTSVEKALEILLYNVAGALAGTFATAERNHRAALRTALDEQQRLQRQLVRAGRLGALGEVVAGIAHEIRNPLHALRGTAEIVDPFVPKECEERRMWEIHLSELERLDRVATRFLSFATPSPIHLAPVDLRDVATRLVELVGADARKRGIELEVERPDAAVMVNADRDQLAQIALNITLNAMRAVGPSGTIRVRVLPRTSPRRAAGSAARGTEPAGATVALAIDNDGPPIPEGELEHLFDPFHSGRDGGTGLGLSISERIAEQHGGTIEAANTECGVSFMVVLPAA